MDRSGLAVLKFIKGCNHHVFYLLFQRSVLCIILFRTIGMFDLVMVPNACFNYHDIDIYCNVGKTTQFVFEKVFDNAKTVHIKDDEVSVSVFNVGVGHGAADTRIMFGSIFGPIVACAGFHQA